MSRTLQGAGAGRFERDRFRAADALILAHTWLNIALQEEMRQVRETLDILLLRVGGSTPPTAGSSPLKLTEFGLKRWRARQDSNLRPSA